MIFIVPIVVFFDYAKAYKDKWVDMVIPLIGVGLLVAVYFEGLFKILKAYLTKFMSSKPSDDTELDAINGIKNLIGK